MNVTDLLIEMDLCAASQIPVFIARTFEETVLVPAMKARYGAKYYEWDAIMGLKHPSTGRILTETPAPTEALAVLNKILNTGTQIERSNNIFVFKDLHLHKGKPEQRPPDIIRAMRICAQYIATTPGRNLIVISGPLLNIPTELEKMVKVVDLDLPTKEQIADHIKVILAEHAAATLEPLPKKGKKADALAEFIEAGAHALQGLTELEEKALTRYSIAKCNGLNAEAIDMLHAEKVAILKKNSFLEYIEPVADFSKIGGLEYLKSWLKLRYVSLTPAGEKAVPKLPRAKGVLICGVPGTGKSAISRALGSEFKIPAFRLDIGSLFSKWVGDTEQNFIRVTKALDAIGPCILFIDEIEKAFNSNAVSGQSSQGTGSRSFSTFLTWAADHKSPVFVVATSNDYLTLPPELVRKGRFDEIFWVDAPKIEERKKIFEVQLTNYGYPVNKFKIDQLAKETDEYTGAEIEEIIKSSMFVAYDRGLDLNQTILLEEIPKVVPLFITNRESIDAMRKQAAGRLKGAGKEDELNALISGIITED